MTAAIASTDRRARRLLDRLHDLFALGCGAGTTRLGLSAEEQRAHDLTAGWMREAGLEVEVDGAGNLWGVLPGADRSLPEVWSGSHLDTPPGGGAFDGALGVLAALDAAAAIGAAGGARRGIRVVAFRLEEGPRFGRGVFGSRALVGNLEPDEGDLRDADGVSLGEAFAALRLGELPAAALLERPPVAFVEPHIEQGPRLAELGAPVAAVSSIAGMAGFEVAFTGRRGHAGTVPMRLRADAVAAAAAFVTDLLEAARRIPEAVATVGRIRAEPGATNTVAEHAVLFADVRAPDGAGIARLIAAVRELAGYAARRAGCTVRVDERWNHAPQPLDAATTTAVREAIARCGHRPLELPSGAGHDAGILAAAGIPSAILFVRSDAGGVSHAPEESTGRDAVAACLAVMETLLRELTA